MADTNRSEHANGVESSSKAAGKASMTPPAPDSLYYFRIVVFQIGNTIFRVPRNGFEVPGTIFETMFSLPTGDDSHLEGSSDANPIHLPVDEKYFRGFLGAMYPFGGRTMTNEDWLGALDLATMWMFDDIRKKAIQELGHYIQTRNAKDAALLAKKYRVLDWLKAAYIRLLQQHTLTTEELMRDPKLDWETIGRLFSVKFQVAQPSSSSYAGRCQYCGRNNGNQQNNFQPIMDKEFRQEFDGMAPGTT